MKNLKILAIIICILYASYILSDQSIATDWNEVSLNYIKVQDYTKKICISNLAVESLKLQEIFYKKNKKEVLYKNGYLKFGLLQKGSLAITSDSRNSKQVKDSIIKYDIGYREEQLYIRENQEGKWVPLTFRFIKELPNPYKDDDDDSPFDKIWILNIQSKFFNGNYVLLVCSGDFQVKD